jgi:hypothetical protein
VLGTASRAQTPDSKSHRDRAVASAVMPVQSYFHGVRPVLPFQAPSSARTDEIHAAVPYIVAESKASARLRNDKRAEGI